MSAASSNGKRFYNLKGSELIGAKEALFEEKEDQQEGYLSLGFHCCKETPRPQHLL